ncbi:MAG: 23S rRNA (pseudouridine(1915)-N(3))-methyltransferase RlmH [Muribaculaceae bacterium]|nr:23S rRNA (pseudouridine(1915)-N(3))-methyltransferase RlmH [Muribaculaceae bacterium]MDE7108788.1 23S rRNA (pseudouridine(1915)-N(3))-methyltransferase RlmH [Muribaculaceae bacterium]
MEIILLTIGKTSQTFIQAGIDEYLKRLKRYVSFKIETIPDLKSAKSLTAELQKEKEGDAILNSITTSDFCILLDERGKEYTSVEFSGRLQKIMASGRKRAVFIVGGPYGFSQAVYNRADEKISFSKMTFTHEMIRLFFTEQIYRAMTILKGEPYHHD